MNPAAIYLHVLDGRLRLKVPEVKNSPDAARELEARLHLIDGVHHVAANPVTGSVLIFYDATRTMLADITELLEAWGYLRDVPPVRAATNAAAGGWGNLMLRATTEFALQQLLTAFI